MFEGLVRISWLTGEPEPSLARSWETSSDNLRWTFHLRENVRWHDGELFTAEDVVFTFNQIIYNNDIPAKDRDKFNTTHNGSYPTTSERKHPTTSRTKAPDKT